MSLSELRHYKEVYSTGMELMRAASFQELFDTALPSFCDTFDAPMATFMVAQPDCAGDYNYRWAGWARGIDSSAVDLYLDQYQAADPMHRQSNAALQVSDHAVGMLSSMDQRAFLRSRLYQELFRPRGIRWELWMSVRSPCGTRGVMGLLRSQDMRDFSREDAAKLRALVPAIECSVSRLSALRQRADEALLTDILAGTVCVEPVVILDPAGQPVFINELARALLSTTSSRRKATPANRYNLPDRVWPACQSLQASLQSDPSAPMRHVEHMQIPDGDLVNADITLVKCRAGGPRFLVRLQRETSAATRGRRLEQLGLSRRQLAVAQLLLEGRSNPQIAAALHISVRTVENHLRDVYAKASVHNRTAFVTAAMTPLAAV
jgi:DNA-binding CsgD family transcriptional regulator